jgi:hypothetical protein
MTLFTLLLALAAFAAGFVDAVVGGGGLISMPALMLGLPSAPLPVVLGINKVQSFTGTTFATAQFLRSGALRLRELVAPVLVAMLGASGGVALAYRVKGDFLRPLMLGLLVLMLLWTLLKPDLGHVHAPKYGLAHQRGLSVLIALGIGFYDGFFGPGTGSLLIFLFVAVLGFDFLRASALAKSVNWASNAASVALFVGQGSWIPGVALAMAVGNGLGGTLGAHVALTRGARFVRVFFMVVVSALILRLGWQQFRT